MSVFIGMGSNRGNRMDNLRQALEALAQVRGTEVAACAPVYESEPWGRKDQGWFYNTVVRVVCDLTPDDLLHACMEIERHMNTGIKKDWGPREMDLDLLLAGETVIDTPRLQVPHPRLSARRFVLVPLADLAPDAKHPVSGKTVRQLLAETPDRSVVRRRGPALSAGKGR